MAHAYLEKNGPCAFIDKWSLCTYTFISGHCIVTDKWLLHTFRKIVYSQTSGPSYLHTSGPVLCTYRQVVIVYLQTSSPCVLIDNWSLCTYRQVVIVYL